MSLLDLRSLYDPWKNPNQVRAHLAPERFVLYGGAMGGGKTAWLVNDGLQRSLSVPGNVGFIGRWENTAFQRTTYLQMEKFIPKDVIEREHKTERYFLFKNGSRIYYGGLREDKPGQESAANKLRSMELGWFGLDEAHEIPEKFFVMLASRLRHVPMGSPRDAMKYRGSLGCNPEPCWIRGRFIDKALGDHVFIPALARDNPFLPADYEAGLRELYPADWVQRYLDGDWNAFMGEHYVFPYAAIRAAVDRSLDKDMPIQLGVDVARYGNDMSVVTVRWGPVMDIRFRVRGNDTQEVADKAAEVAKDEKDGVVNHLQEQLKETGDPAIEQEMRKVSVQIKVDTVGVGAGVADALRRKGHNVTDINGSAKPMKREKFKNLRAELHWALRERLEEGNIDLPDDTGLIAQLSAIKFDYDTNDRIQIESKDNVKERLGYSPDDSDSAIYCFARPIARPGFFFAGGTR
jgi:ferritin-like protein